jgi:FRG domain
MAIGSVVENLEKMKVELQQLLEELVVSYAKQKAPKARAKRPCSEVGTVKDAHELEHCAKTSRSIFQFIMSWAAPEVDNLLSRTVKTNVLKGNALPSLETLLSRKLLEKDVAKQLREAITHYQNVRYEVGRRTPRHAEAGLIFDNIYDLLIYSTVQDSFAEDNLATIAGAERLYIYRGQFDATWELIPSYYRRSRPCASGSSEAAYVDHIERRMADLQQKFPKIKFDLTFREREAVVQHYYSDTKLLDFSQSMFIAAYFATDVPHKTRSELPGEGAIYRIRTGMIQRRKFGIVEAPTLPQSFRRMHAQKGCFIDIDYERRNDLYKASLLERWIFPHTDAGLNFEFPAIGVTTEGLLPPDIISLGVGH